ncbi:MAG: NAD(P)/FAD-dependent oxidoreductase, partial [Myxococcales bacterium]|nr:NAD(P)/FAD-dependent oxidoreductase [Myxococcales bacterium]
MPDAAAVSCHEVLIIGAGISGIGAAIRLLGAGFRDFVVLEKADALGGTWRDNTYPGCACDVPAALYSYSFAQRSDWSRAFAGQAEILAYVQDVAARHGVLRFIRFRQAVARAQWREAERVWEVETGDRRYRARVLITCAGYLHEPIIPDIPGLSAFPGPVFHSSRWDHELELAGARVAVIGTGASAIQFVPQIQPKLRQLTIYQRTPQWVLPKLDHAIPPIERRLLSLPLALQAWRTALYGGFEALGVGFRRPALLRR